MISQKITFAIIGGILEGTVIDKILINGNTLYLTVTDQGQVHMVKPAQIEKIWNQHSTPSQK